MKPALRFSALILIPMLVSAPTPADELCVLAGEGLCCSPCDVPFPLGANGFSTEGPPCVTGGDFSISGSPTDPLVNMGELAQFGSLHLWVFASSGPGYGFSSGELEFGGDLVVLDYEHVAGGSGTFDAATQKLSINLPCVNGINLVGKIQVFDPVSVESESWSEVKARWR